jgi:site-specific recombinase XerD
MNAVLQPISGHGGLLLVEPSPAVDSRLAGELVDRVVGELPALAELGVREQLLAAAWLLSLRAVRTRRAYFGDFLVWQRFCSQRDVDVLAAVRVHVDLWVTEQADASAEASSVRRRLSAVTSFYRYCAAHDLVDRIPTAGVARPVVDPDYTATIGLDRDQARALLAAADVDTGRQALRTAAVIRVLATTALRVDEATSVDVADLGMDKGHRVVNVVGKGNRRAKVVLPPATWAAVQAYLQDRAGRAGLADWQQLRGPLLATATGGRLRQSHLWELVRRVAKAAGLECWAVLSPHSLRHTAITLALDAGATLRDVQDFARHKDPRTTRRYDHTRQNLDRSPAYTLASYLF